MWITVGWHYAKQTFGIALTNARYASYPMTRHLVIGLRVHLLCVAAVAFFYLISRESTGLAFMGLEIIPLKGSLWLFYVACCFAVVTGLAIFVYSATVFFAEGIRPSPQMFIVISAFYVWWIPGVFPFQFAPYVVPFFHSLQYLPFAYAMEGDKQKSFFRWFFALATAGFLAFELLPYHLDKTARNYELIGVWYLSIAVSVFLNVHHFFIDSVIWRSRNDDFRQNIL